ncbi:unnamed protein product [Colletotrichum noveboracense]|uniref:Uncharacterized protein n=1 Tax=Colletotrichum noveboracense TaxID=2664923 RepID=A0A9W4S540_9PEZI|nr:unnamed protein product [Colletotrichum noveboracense]
MADHQQVRLLNEAAAAASAASAAGEGQRQDRGGSNVDNNNFNRPSFSDYWQGEKESERAGRVQFVTEGPPPGTSGPSSSAAAVTATSTSSASPQPLDQRRQGSYAVPLSGYQDSIIHSHSRLFPGSMGFLLGAALLGFSGDHLTFSTALHLDLFLCLTALEYSN